MAAIASEAIITRLADWGVDTMFGIPGDGINGIMEGLRRHQDKIRFVFVHHEEAAAFMATGYAKATGKLGACLATSGPGGIHLLNGLYDAKLDHAPVLAITGMQETSVLGTSYQQEVNLDKLYADVAEYDQMVYNPAQLPAVVDNAVRTAYARRGVAHITVPNDIQVADADADPWQHVAPARSPHTASVMLTTPGQPDEQDLRSLAGLLDEGSKIAILVGAGALGAGDEVLELAEVLAAPVVKTLSRQGGNTRRLAIHHRRHRAARDQADRRPDGRDRHAAHDRDELSVHQAPARAWQGQGRPDRGRPGQGRC